MDQKHRLLGLFDKEWVRIRERLTTGRQAEFEDAEHRLEEHRWWTILSTPIAYEDVTFVFGVCGARGDALTSTDQGFLIPLPEGGLFYCMPFVHVGEGSLFDDTGRPPIMATRARPQTQQWVWHKVGDEPLVVQAMPPTAFFWGIFPTQDWPPGVPDYVEPVRRQETMELCFGPMRRWPITPRRPDFAPAN